MMLEPIASILTIANPEQNREFGHLRSYLSALRCWGIVSASRPDGIAIATTREDGSSLFTERPGNFQD
jgi:hypothetical protein